MAVAFDAISAAIVKNQVSDANANGTASITLSASATIAVAFIECSLAGGNSDADIVFDTCTLNSAPMTELPGARIHSGGGNHGFSTVFYLLAPSTGTQTFSIAFSSAAFSGNIHNLLAFCCSYTGALQSGAEIGTAKTFNPPSSSSGSLTDTLAAGDLIVGSACNGSSTPTITVGNSRGSQAGDTSTASHAGIIVGDNSGTGSVSLTFGLNSGDSSAGSGVKLVASTGAPPTATAIVTFRRRQQPVTRIR